MIIALVKIIELIRNLISININKPDAYDKLQVIYCCDYKLKAIRNQVIDYAKINKIPFGIACIKNEDEISITYSVNTTERECLLIVADVYCTSKLLVQKRDSYVLFFDEITAFLDEESLDTKNQLEILLNNLPLNTILSSATLPPLEQILPLVNLYSYLNFPQSNSPSTNNVVVIKSTTSAKIGSEIYNLEGDLYYPNKYADNYSKLDEVILKCNNNKFISKLYTPKIVAKMWNNISTISTTNLSESIKSQIDENNFVNLFSNPGNITQTSMEKTAITYLNIIKEINNTDILNEFNTLNLAKNDPIDFENLYIYKQIRFRNQTLIITCDIVSFINKYFKQSYDIFLELLKKEKLTQDQVFKSINKYVNENEDITKTFKFICRFKLLYYTNQINLLNLPSEVAFAFLLGIGVYAPNDPNIPAEFTNLVISIANQGYFAYIISNTDIAYGTNWEIENILIDKTCFQNNAHSIDTLFQLFARAGRVGKSWKATIYCDHEIIMMLNNFIFSNEDVNESGILKKIITNIVSKNHLPEDILSSTPNQNAGGIFYLFKSNPFVKKINTFTDIYSVTSNLPISYNKKNTKNTNMDSKIVKISNNILNNNKIKHYKIVNNTKKL